MVFYYTKFNYVLNTVFFTVFDRRVIGVRYLDLLILIIRVFNKFKGPFTKNSHYNKKF